MRDSARMGAYRDCYEFFHFLSCFELLPAQVCAVPNFDCFFFIFVRLVRLKESLRRRVFFLRALSECFLNNIYKTQTQIVAHQYSLNIPSFFTHARSYIDRNNHALSSRSPVTRSHCRHAVPSRDRTVITQSRHAIALSSRSPVTRSRRDDPKDSFCRLQKKYFPSKRNFELFL